VLQLTRDGGPGVAGEERLVHPERRPRGQPLRRNRPRGDVVFEGSVDQPQHRKQHDDQDDQADGCWDGAAQQAGQLAGPVGPKLQ
jgi:hypothetical protein